MVFSIINSITPTAANNQHYALHAIRAGFGIPLKANSVLDDPAGPIIVGLGPKVFNQLSHHPNLTTHDLDQKGRVYYAGHSGERDVLFVPKNSKMFLHNAYRLKNGDWKINTEGREEFAHQSVGAAKISKDVLNPDEITDGVQRVITRICAETNHYKIGDFRKTQYADRPQVDHPIQVAITRGLEAGYPEDEITEHFLQYAKRGMDLYSRSSGVIGFAFLPDVPGLFESRMPFAMLQKVTYGSMWGNLSVTTIQPGAQTPDLGKQMIVAIRSACEEVGFTRGQAEQITASVFGALSSYRMDCLKPTNPFIKHFSQLLGRILNAGYTTEQLTRLITENFYYRPWACYLDGATFPEAMEIAAQYHSDKNEIIELIIKTEAIIRNYSHSGQSWFRELRQILETLLTRRDIPFIDFQKLLDDTNQFVDDKSVSVHPSWHTLHFLLAAGLSCEQITSVVPRLIQQNAKNGYTLLFLAPSRIGGEESYRRLMAATEGTREEVSQKLDALDDELKAKIPPETIIDIIAGCYRIHFIP